jgi:hypothetical protein
LALPSEAPGLSYFKHLPKVLGKTAGIDLQGVSAAVPKQSISRERYNAAYAAKIRQHGGVVSVHTVRNRCGGDPFFRVGHLLGTGDPAAARVLGEFVSAREVKLAP